MRLTYTLILILTAAPVAAHPGHLADVAGHNHWVAGAVIGAAVLAGLWGALTGGKKDAEADAEADVQDEEVAA